MSKIFAAFSLILFIFLISGCSKQPEEMSTVRPNLILEIFKLIKQEKHEEAYVKIKKLRELDQTNTHLPILEDAEKNNSELQKVNRLLRDDKKQKEATALLKEIIESKGIVDESSVQTAEKLRDVMRMEILTDIIINPKPSFSENQGFRPASKVLQDAIEEFIQITQKWNVPVSLRNKVIKRLANVSVLRKEERERAVVSLELFAPGLKEQSYQTMMAMSSYAETEGTK